MPYLGACFLGHQLAFNQHHLTSVSVIASVMRGDSGSSVVLKEISLAWAPRPGSGVRSCFRKAGVMGGVMLGQQPVRRRNSAVRRLSSATSTSSILKPCFQAVYHQAGQPSCEAGEKAYQASLIYLGFWCCSLSMIISTIQAAAVAVTEKNEGQTAERHLPCKTQAAPGLSL
jgi:hypothetical protein